MILKAGDEYTREVYISLLRASKSTVKNFHVKNFHVFTPRFASKTKHMKVFYSYTSLKHTVNNYYYHY